MQTLNVLIAAQKDNGLIEQIKSSHLLNKLFTTFPVKESSIASISFNTFQELAVKCRTLQIDIVIVEEDKWILQGIGDVMRVNHINCFAPTSNWTNLELSNSYARNMLEKYAICIPKKINLPVDFPVMVRADGIAKKANSIQEIIDIKKEIFNTSTNIAQTIYVEEFLGEEFEILTSLFDGKNLAVFENLNLPQESIIEYSRKLKTMLTQEKADFIGFINSKVILHNNKLYNIGFDFSWQNPKTSKDLLFVLQLAIYQKLNELNLQSGF